MIDAVKINNITAGYHDSVVLKDLSLSIPQGEISAVIGPNGAGKTTLIRAMTGLISLTAGEILLFDQNLMRLNSKTRSQLVGVVPQEMETPMAFTVEQIVMMGRTSRLKMWQSPSENDLKAVERAMVYTDVVDMRLKPFQELSGGEKQRAIIAMVLAQDPKMILMDEATSHLDINHRLEIMQILERLNTEHGVTILMISHDLNLASEFCHRLILMNKGEVMSNGSPAEVLNEETLREVYRCDVKIQKDQFNGSVTVVPTHRLILPHLGKGIHVHVIAGGGCAEEILRRLSLCDYKVTCGALNQGDMDADVAAALSITTSLEKPFSPISKEALIHAIAIAEGAHAVIISEVPFGPGNLVNLDIAEKALANGKQVLIMKDIESRDYTPEKEATKRINLMKEQGAFCWHNTTDLINTLNSLFSKEGAK